MASDGDHLRRRGSGGSPWPLRTSRSREAAGDFNFSLLWFVPGYGVAVALHTAFNQFPDRPGVAMMGAIIIAPVALIAILSLGAAEAQRWLAAESAEHRAQVEALRTGRWPDGPAGRKIAALAGRLDDESAKRIRRYWELQAWLVAEAEETMMEEAAGDAEFDPAQVRAALAGSGSPKHSGEAHSQRCRPCFLQSQ